MSRVGAAAGEVIACILAPGTSGAVGRVARVQFEPTFETTPRLVLRRPTDADRAFHTSVHSDLRGWQAACFLNLYYRFAAEAQGRGLAKEGTEPPWRWHAGSTAGRCTSMAAAGSGSVPPRGGTAGCSAGWGQARGGHAARHTLTQWPLSTTSCTPPSRESEESSGPGQVEMAHAVEDAVAKDEHLLVQAGTGTGKSLAYLIPAVMHAQKTGKPAVVATATLALQAQIVDRDMPRLAESIAPLLGQRPTYGLVKGRRNYLCAHKLEGGFPDDEEGLFEVGEVDRAASRLGQEVVRLREWADTTESGDRDELVPGVSERAWRQVSVSAHECMGSKCPAFADCFVERSREAAKDCDVIVTNHSFMAIDSLRGPPDAARARPARRRRGARAGRPGHLDDHRRDHADHGQRGGQAGRPAGRVDRGRRRRRRSSCRASSTSSPRASSTAYPTRCRSRSRG